MKKFLDCKMYNGYILTVNEEWKKPENSETGLEINVELNNNNGRKAIVGLYLDGEISLTITEDENLIIPNTLSEGFSLMTDHGWDPLAIESFKDSITQWAEAVNRKNRIMTLNGGSFPVVGAIIKVSDKNGIEVMKEPDEALKEKLPHILSILKDLLGGDNSDDSNH